MARKKTLKRRREDNCLGGWILRRVHLHLRNGCGRTMDPRYVAAAKDALRIMERAWDELEADARDLGLNEAAQ